MNADADSKLVLTSSVFTDGEFIPRKYTGEGADVSPPGHGGHRERRGRAEVGEWHAAAVK